MEKLFVSKVKIDKVRHLKNIEIDLSDQEKRHLILTGKNGSGKTSVLNAIAAFFELVTIGGLDPIEAIDTSGVILEMACPVGMARIHYRHGGFITAYYKTDRVFKAQIPKHVEKIELKDSYMIQETPREDFIKYLLDLKMTQALATAAGKKEKADKIGLWFKNFNKLLKNIFGDNSVFLDFDEDTFQFRIMMHGREPFDFNTLSSGYAAILDIVVDLIIRMEKQTNRGFDFSVPGVVLIDEIETHLHLELQKKVLGLLTTIFPNIQFIVSTHSPFILNSLENTVIYNLED